MDEERRETVYTYGEGDSAADRLALVAELSEGATASFLAEAVGFRPRLALDLGCGLGHTTRLIAEVLRPDRVVGVERSANFLSKARATVREGISFVEHDVTRMPLPHGGEVDLIYARMLLSHLPDPEGPLRTGSGNSRLEGCSCWTKWSVSRRSTRCSARTWRSSRR